MVAEIGPMVKLKVAPVHQHPPIMERACSNRSAQIMTTLANHYIQRYYSMLEM